MPMTDELKNTILNTGVPKTMYAALLLDNGGSPGTEICRVSMTWDTYANGKATHSADVNWPAATADEGTPAWIIYYKASTGTTAWTTPDPITLTPPAGGDNIINAGEYAQAKAGTLTMGI